MKRVILIISALTLQFTEKIGSGGTAIAQEIAPEFLRDNYFLEFSKP